MSFKKYLLAGLLVWLPLTVTVWLLTWLVSSLDSVFALVLATLSQVSPASAAALMNDLGKIHGLGVVLVVATLLVSGAFASNVVGKWWLNQWGKIFARIPVFKTIYTSVKRVSDTLFSSNGNAFRQTLLVQYPRAGVWTLAFQTGEPSGAVHSKLGDGFVSVYVPTTPNPTSGFFLLMPKSEVIELDISVDEALTYIISMGSVAPELARSDQSCASGASSFKV
jgi:uncharacterized membrane protein